MTPYTVIGLDCVIGGRAIAAACFARGLAKNNENACPTSGARKSQPPFKPSRKGTRAFMSSITREDILDLAIRLGRHEYVDPQWILYPTWVSPPPDYLAMMNIAACFRRMAAGILRGEIPKPAWMIKEDAPPAPPPDLNELRIIEIAGRMREWPLIAACAVYLRFTASDVSTHPPPLPRWRFPCRARPGDAVPAIPALSRGVRQTPVLLFDNRIVVNKYAV